MTTISLCMIVKNEASVLERCLDSVADLMDEIIIVDTGSTDNTKEIAKKYTDKIYDFPWIDDFSAARNFSFEKATMEYIYAPDADELLDEMNRARFHDLKTCLLPEIEIVQMIYLTENEHNTVMNYTREYRPKLFRRLRTFTWIDPIHETVRLDPVVYNSDIEIIHRPQASHGKRDFSIFEKSYQRDGVLSPKVLSMYAKELLKCGDLQDFEHAKPIFLKPYMQNPFSDAGKEAACILTHYAREMGNIAEMMKYALRDMLEQPCAEICYELGCYYETQGDFDEAIVWYQNAAEETSSILDIRTNGILPLEGLVRCYEAMLPPCTNEDTAKIIRERISDYRTQAENWIMPEEA